MGARMLIIDEIYALLAGLLSCWQERVACHYGCTATELELWLDPSAGQSIDGFERRDFDPGASIISLWAKACHMDECGSRR
jgi:hypothetical protein